MFNSEYRQPVKNVFLENYLCTRHSFYMETVDNDNFVELTEQSIIETLVNARKNHKSLHKDLVLL
jgi:hypothetical protein